MIVCATAATEHEAIRSGTFEMARLLEREYGMKLSNALFLLTMTAHLRCARTGVWGDHGPVATVTLSQKLLQAALADRAPRQL